MEAIQQHRVCPVEMAGMLTSPLRRLTLNPRALLAPFVRPGMACLDYGCGPGFFTLPMLRLAGPGGEVTAADIQEAMLELLRFRVENVPGPERGAALRYYPTARGGLGHGRPLDFVLIFHVLHEVGDPAALFREVMSALKPGGTVLLAEPLGHVSRREWESSLLLARHTGFRITPGPAIAFSRSALLWRAP